MNFRHLFQALGSKVAWIYLCAVVVSVWEVATDAKVFHPSVLTQFVVPIADAAGLDFLDEVVYRACLRKILAEHFLPLARLLRDAFRVDSLMVPWESVDDDFFDPIAQETVTQGFRINGQGNTVLSLSNLLTWVLKNGLRNPAVHGPILSLQRVRRFGVAFPSVPRIFLDHINVCDEMLSPNLDAVAATDSLEAAHTYVNDVMEGGIHCDDVTKYDFLRKITMFVKTWGVEFPHFYLDVLEDWKEQLSEDGEHLEVIEHHQKSEALWAEDKAFLDGEKEEDAEGKEKRLELAKEFQTPLCYMPPFMGRAPWIKPLPADCGEDVKRSVTWRAFLDWNFKMQIEFRKPWHDFFQAAVTYLENFMTPPALLPMELIVNMDAENAAPVTNPVAMAAFSRPPVGFFYCRAFPPPPLPPMAGVAHPAGVA
jgi:hypothetical protein